MGERPPGSGRRRKGKGAESLRHQSHVALLLSEKLSDLSPNGDFYGKFSLQGLGGQLSEVPLSPLSAGCWLRQDFQGWDLPTS